MQKDISAQIEIELVDHIKVYENGNISVHFKFADEFHRIAEYIEINTTDTAEAGLPPPKYKILLAVCFPNKTQSYLM